jgi:hypothetical protein
MPQLSAAEIEERARARLLAETERFLDEKVAEGSAEKFTDEAGEVRYRQRPPA